MRRETRDRRTPLSAQRITLGLGIFYVAIGILGFVPGITTNGMLLGIFAVNALHNIAHLVLGAGLIWGSMSPAITTVNKPMAVVFGVLVIAGVVAPIVELLPINPPRSILHLARAPLTAYLGFFAPATAMSRVELRVRLGQPKESFRSSRASMMSGLRSKSMRRGSL